MPKRSTAVYAWESLFRAQVQVMRVLNDEFPTHSISINEYDILFNLSLEPEHSARLRLLNSRVLLSQPSVSRMVDRLVERGYVEKVQDASDGRGTIVHMTDAGYREFRSIAVKHMASITNVMQAALTDDELTQLTELTTKVRTTTAGC
ncbi:MarR family winged helix-turn-helix transcriptional regulator [Microbacterium sp. MPKO10]|uniref:MarR family winged helix-turn-helix transcriptional regulator n=1 Tax=Microbacterium sp. MPKO10 TaxID=2989818 RepID=UPI00223543B1|nr:MarR family winged helix-turn-helix transcriptional regulator [Microbacterium sp. MPKO10]MCW4456758.1 MarR family winged helix-turn-helix transcriptional regulator [Microbacterium sp. MPKO10]